MEKTFFDKCRYQFDNFMSRGTGALLGALTILTAGMILFASLILWLTKASPDHSFPQLLWASLMRAMDAGTVAGDSGSFGFMLVMFVTTIGGIFILSMLIGLLTTGIEAKAESLRKGKSAVIENDHTIILGWSEQIFTIISELIVANANRKRPCIVIMGDKDKAEMDDEIRERIEHKGNTRIICRRGSPIEMSDLNIVSLNTARSIIIIQDSDSDVIKTILTVINYPQKRETPYNIAAVLRSPQNAEVAQIGAKGQVETILVDQLIAKLIAQTCRQPGLSAVYMELLDFDGYEIYFANADALEGKHFKDAILMHEDSCLLGIHSDGITKVNPPMNTIIQKGDQIIVISEDDDTIKLSNLANYAINEQAIVSAFTRMVREAEKTLILGWNDHAINIIKEIDCYVSPDSLVTVVCDFKEAKEVLEKAAVSISNQKTELIMADIKDRNVLQGLVEKNYKHIIILSNDTYTDIQKADADTLITLLQLRDISEKTGFKFSVVSEMLDVRNRKLAEITKVNDFIISDKIVSLLLTQVSENRLLNSVFADLFDADGSEIYIKPITDYIKLENTVNFYTIAKAASKRNEIAIGYKLSAEENDAAKNYGIYINPAKSKMISLTPDDCLIVIAEE